MTRLDGKTVRARGTWLDTCKDAGVEIPAICAEDRSGSGGHCRACMIEVDGRMVSACTTPAREGAIAVTNSEALRAYRRDLGELMLSEAAPAGRVGRWLAEWGADGSRYGRATPTGRHDHSHTAVRYDADRCITCRRCIEACETTDARFVFAVEGRGSSTHLAWGGGALVDTACDACGACVSACPTEALTAGDGGPKPLA